MDKDSQEFEDFDNDPIWVELEKEERKIEELSNQIDDLFDWHGFLDFALENYKYATKSLQELERIFFLTEDITVKGLICSNQLSVYEGFIYKIICKLFSLKFGQMAIKANCTLEEIKNNTILLELFSKRNQSKLKKAKNIADLLDIITTLTLNNHIKVVEILALFGFTIDNSYNNENKATIYFNNTVKVRNLWIHKDGFIDSTITSREILSDKAFTNTNRNTILLLEAIRSSIVVKANKILKDIDDSNKN